jgi:hypothetical protein
MPSPRVAVATSIGSDTEANLARAYAALSQESKIPLRHRRATLEVGLRCSNLVVWIYAGAQFLHAMS